MLPQDVITSLLPAIRRVSFTGNDFVFQQDSAPAHHAVHVQQLLRQGTPNFLAPNLWPPNSSDVSPVDYEIWAVMQHRSTTDKSIVCMNQNGGSSMPGEVLNSRYLTRLLTSGEENIDRVSMIKEDISSTACEFTMLILTIFVTFNMTCLTGTLRNHANNVGQYILVHFTRYSALADLRSEI